jgi:sigma-E factor negative regulatory protein RseC
MEELATVTAIDNDAITVISQIKSTCNSCAQVDSCANGQVAKAIPMKKLSFTLDKPKALTQQHITIGDRVVLTVPEIDVLHSAWQVYLLPVFGLFIFSGFGQWLVQEKMLSHELIALAIGMSGGYLGYRLAKKLQDKPNKRKRLQPKILRVLPKALNVGNINVN